MRILIDADGCPVVDAAICVAKEYNIECLIFCDTSHFFERSGATTITVSQGADSVDFILVNKAQKGDVVVTQDYGLAAMCLAKNARALNQDGLVYTENNIDALLDQRFTARKIRMSGGRIKGNAKRKKEQDLQFIKSLRRLLIQAE